MKIIFYRIGTDGEEYFKNNSMLEQLKLNAIFQPNVISENHPPSNEGLDAEILGVYVDSKLSKQTLEKFPNLKLIAALSTGYDHIDLTYCKEKNIKVVYVPSYGERSVAEYTFGLILVLAKKILLSNSLVRQPNIRRAEKIKGFDLDQKTIGVIGTGKIGKNVIRIAKSFEMKVFAYDLFPDNTFAEKTNFNYLPLEGLLKQSDIVTLHVPLLEETHHLINKNNISLMKQNSYIINTSRGPVIETEALFDALVNKKISGAALDVLEEEEITFRGENQITSQNTEENNRLRTATINNKLLELENVIITPHNASNTIDAHQRIFETTLSNIKNFLENNPTNIIS